MIEIFVHVIAWCQSCVPDAQSAAPAVGIIGGAASAIAAIGELGGGGLNSAPSAAAFDATDTSTADAGPSNGDGGSSAFGGNGSADGGDANGGDGGSGGDDLGGHTFTDPPSNFNNTTGGFQMHEPPDPPEFPDDPFHSPSANPQPIYSDGSQVDGSSNPGDDTTETDYINRDGTPLGSSPATPHHGPGTHPQPGHPRMGKPL